MKQVWTIAWKEWRTFVDTPLGYVVTAAFLLASGFLFGNKLFLYGQAEMREYFAWLPVLFMFFIPALSMRTFAEEQRIGTFELLATLPVTEGQIVAGKFAAIMLQVGVLLGFTLIYPVSLALLGDVDGGQIAASYLAAFLLAGSFAAVCMFASALTNNAVVAYVVGFGVLFAIFLLSQAAAFMPVYAQDWLELFSPVRHYMDLLRGAIGLEDVCYLLAFCAILLAAALHQLERRRWT